MLILLASCEAPKEQSLEKADPILAYELKYTKSETLLETGDFNGDGIQDTLRSYAFSIGEDRYLDSIADPFEISWDSTVAWVYEKKIVQIIRSSFSLDSIVMSNAFGLYIMKNLGDLNQDGKDDLAIAIDLADYSRINSCKIFSFCSGKWKQVKRFGIHEGSLDFTSGTSPVFNEIPEFLEQKDGRWYYKDNELEAYGTEEEVGKMLELVLPKCTN